MVDYSLYLVTGRDLLPQGKDYVGSLEEAIKGGATIVQVREKGVDTLEFLEIALQSKALCEKYKVPLIINDRIDIALAVQADGVHLGQTDMPVHIARNLLPPGTLVGVSCNNIKHIKKAVEEGADYVGIGAVWGTTTKQLTSPTIGVRGVGTLLEALEGTAVKAVAIGGIKSTNLLRTLHGTVSSSGRCLDGIAVVSDVFASSDPLSAAKDLRDIFTSFSTHISKQAAQLASWQASPKGTLPRYTPDSIKDGVVNIMRTIRDSNPLVHQITNVVVTNQSANATLALGASPIMATAPEEMYDLSRVPGALLINFGTVKDKEGMILAGKFANDVKKPVVFDPVGVGATQFRRKTAAELLDIWQASVIKGNAGELAALADSKEVQARGVDSVGSGFADPAAFVKALAKKERCIVVLTSPTDWVSDGDTVVRLDNGDKMLGNITGSGCMVGTCIAVFCAGSSLLCDDETAIASKLVKGDMFLGAIGGVMALTIAAELAVARKDVLGSGTFLPALIDELSHLTPEAVREKAKVQVL
ncbi:Hydroxyethylthiazole kinase [Leucogyrophana mollusca]|uniref:Hydroxyethylthiazole kinase n=1 Tax=Leucogyrophana mollusca TaxID=85980 RepID=A0ACB8BPJ3_9AGAM|nr:Hydroxyethylthiazole kinase [Leucogyrophana mollusca]